MHSHKSRWALLVLLACLSLTAQAQSLRIVSEAWAPYVYEEDGQLTGQDYDAARIVLERLGVEAEWQLMPWKRCLLALEQGRADAILDIFRTTKREATIIFPEEPLSEIEFVLFYLRSSPQRFNSIADLHGLKVGVSAGYWYANRDFRESTQFVREPAPNHGANFGKLIRQRVDLVINDRLAGRFLLSQMGLSDSVVDNAKVVSRDHLYLGLRREAGLEQLAQRFAEELRRFKQEPAYAALAARYGTGPAPAGSAGAQKHN